MMEFDIPDTNIQIAAFEYCGLAHVSRILNLVGASSGNVKNKEISQLCCKGNLMYLEFRDKSEKCC